MISDARTAETELAALAPLAEPIRRRLYLFVASSADAVSRDDAAGLAISRALVAFHLDRLVEEGLLGVEFARRSGRTGPGAGRPAKLYRRSGRVHAVSLPARNYELAARLFASAIDRPDTGEVRGGVDHLRDEAGAYGRSRGRVMAAEHPGTTPPALQTALTREGFEPRMDHGVVRLGNCPFDALVAQYRDLTCGMNLALMSGLLEGLGADGWRAGLDPRPGLCCVAFEPIDAPIAHDLPSRETALSSS